MGSQSPPRDPELCPLSTAPLDEKPLFPLAPLQKTVVSGNKRGFSDAMDGFPEGNFSANQGVNAMLSSRPPVNSGLKTSVKEQPGGFPSVLKDSPKILHEKMSSPNITGSVPAAKAQVVGWPPIRSFRKNTLATSSKNSEEVDGKPGSGALFVKVSMDGAPYLRKVDLKTYSTYVELSSALEKMFSCFTIGQYGSHGVAGRDKLSESKLRDLLHGSEYVLTYEDKDGDWMLVGDVPWEMFIDSCKRLRIMKGSDAIGLAPLNGVTYALVLSIANILFAVHYLLHERSWLWRLFHGFQLLKYLRSYARLVFCDCILHLHGIRCIDVVAIDTYKL
ncbi:hypothetical protein H6P81_020122 [Aristolochia fimbriata]|uniref:Auxin-responsive protein n=1 Tax=Aristolochia fimbriata TaxID=158543 RepID=A0AAV7DTL7_ARIFI|nr:hypothetical protein H6P81_020122 [Aristolochia fimbriata]